MYFQTFVVPCVQSPLSGPLNLNHISRVWPNRQQTLVTGQHLIAAHILDKSLIEWTTDCEILLKKFGRFLLWTRRKYGEIDLYITQYPGFGCLWVYLLPFEPNEFPVCPAYDEFIENVEHIICAMIMNVMNY